MSCVWVEYFIIFLPNIDCKSVVTEYWYKQSQRDVRGSLFSHDTYGVNANIIKGNKTLALYWTGLEVPTNCFA
jgi:hypothetical protein